MAKYSHTWQSFWKPLKTLVSNQWNQDSKVKSLLQPSNGRPVQPSQPAVVCSDHLLLGLSPNDNLLKTRSFWSVPTIFCSSSDCLLMIICWKLEAFYNFISFTNCNCIAKGLIKHCCHRSCTPGPASLKRSRKASLLSLSSLSWWRWSWSWWWRWSWSWWWRWSWWWWRWSSSWLHSHTDCDTVLT